MLSILPNWHPIFVHFTVALLTVAAAMHVLSHFVSRNELRNQLTITARWNLWIGIAFTVLTVIAGWYAYNTVAHDTPSHVAMTEHRNWAMGTFVVFMGIAAWEYYLHRKGLGRSWLFTVLLVIAASLLVSTAWHGGELVYRYGLGVMSMPKLDNAGHSHGESDMTEDGMTHDDFGMTQDDSGMTQKRQEMPGHPGTDHPQDEPASVPVPHSKAPPHRH